MSILVRDITKRFGDFTALENVSLEVPTGSLLALLGPSGSGKTTLLRIIAGLEVADRGTVLCQNEDITLTNARDRNVGFVFQHYALFRHMNVFENIAFGMRVRKEPKKMIQERVRELLQLVRLEGLERRYPAQLSGGQRQRVALARALAIQPKVLLLDEPFGALDAKVRQELRSWLRRLHDEIHMTSVFVTHDQEEAFEVADHVVVMNRGKIEQSGSPNEVFEHPANSFVMDFLGNVNVFHGRVQNGRAAIRQLGSCIPRVSPPGVSAGDALCAAARIGNRARAERRGQPEGARGKNQPGRFGRQSVFDGNRLRPGVQRRDQSRAECRIGTEDGGYRICFSAQGASVRARVRNLTANLPSLFCKS